MNSFQQLLSPMPESNLTLENIEMMARCRKRYVMQCGRLVPNVKKGLSPDIGGNSGLGPSYLSLAAA